MSMTPAEIKAERLALGMTQPAFAAAFGVKLNTVQKWEDAGPSGSLPAPYWALALAWLKHSRAAERA